MDATWPASAAVAILMIAQAQLASRQLGGWLAPAALFSLAWTAATVASLLSAPEYQIWPGVLWIFFMTCTAHLGGVLVSAELGASSDAEPRQAIRPPPSFPLLLPLLCVSAALAVAGAIYLIQTIGRSFDALFSLNALGEIASHFAGSRYTDKEYREPALFSLLESFLYVAGFLAGTVFAQTPSRISRAIALVAIPVAILTSLVTGARAVTVHFGLCAVAAYCAVRAYAGDQTPWQSARRASAWMAVALAAFTVFFLAVRSVRMDAFGVNPTGSALMTQNAQGSLGYGLATAKNEYVGYVAAFSEWFSENWDRSDAPGLGIYSFDGPANWFGYKVERTPEPIQLSPDTRASETNIFSIFRQMALDWTLPGSAVVLLLMSAFASVAYERARAGSIACIPFLALFYRIALNLTGFALRSTLNDFAWIVFAMYVWFTAMVASGPERDLRNVRRPS